VLPAPLRSSARTNPLDHRHGRALPVEHLIGLVDVAWPIFLGFNHQRTPPPSSFFFFAFFFFRPVRGGGFSFPESFRERGICAAHSPLAPFAASTLARCALSAPPLPLPRHAFVQYARPFRPPVQTMIAITHQSSARCASDDRFNGPVIFVADRGFSTAAKPGFAHQRHARRLVIDETPGTRNRRARFCTRRNIRSTVIINVHWRAQQGAPEISANIKNGCHRALVGPWRTKATIVRGRPSASERLREGWIYRRPVSPVRTDRTLRNSRSSFSDQNVYRGSDSWDKHFFSPFQEPRGRAPAREIQEPLFLSRRAQWPRGLQEFVRTSAYHLAVGIIVPSTGAAVLLLRFPVQLA